ncbi:nuclear transport factor 2 family protein [Bradyrhizobium glycinis]|uniref:nuclear transport factor 2 family protein n=1 Tax=Bradyrhizobium glycinis TaxID=2751812 RepID=UPI0018D8D1B8|nr:nuclear transport factor 2 family protein [Bradyrhizobium glycinis]MBH5367311.1 nuclear transport factor 2 family protein [Bradyrhizobium glycinis]
MLSELTEHAIQSALTRYEELFSRGDVEAIVEDFTEDVRVRYGAHPPFAGKSQLRDLLRQRFARMRDYRLSKRLEFISAPRFASSWTGSWVDAESQMRMNVYGVELLTVRAGRFCEWSAAVTTWQAVEH